ncbi:MAG TPA: GNAT family N-acetyltransferase, partial [Rhizomicrobium sp.]|nr:GNAT family N-acetyltransferase [Rhizomicrobium sp.]
EGTVQLGLAMPPNQPHRADVKKLLVHRASRNAGLAATLMREIEGVARKAGRTLLVLDTVKGGAGERLYTRLGWQRTGVIPDYALFPDGTLCDTVVFWKKV